MSVAIASSIPGSNSLQENQKKCSKIKPLIYHVKTFALGMQMSDLSENKTVKLKYFHEYDLLEDDITKQFIS